MKYSLIRAVFEFPPIIGGSVTHIVELSKAMNPSLNSQLILAPDFAGNEKFDAEFSVPTIRLPYVRLLSFGGFAVPLPILFFYAHTVVGKIDDLSRKNRVDVVHVHGPMLGAFMKFFMRLIELRIPLVVMQHGCGAKRSVGHAVSRQIANLLIGLFPPDYFLLLDDGTEIENVGKFLRKRNIPYEVVLHGIDTDFFKSEKKREGDNEFVILFPHRPVDFKRPDLAIEIFRRFIEITNQRNLRLVLLAAEDAQSLKRIAVKNGIEQYIEFAGKLDVLGVKRCVDLSDVVIGTSLESNMNRAIGEAMACGKPVVVFDSGGTRRLVRHMVNGILVNIGDIEDFAEKLELLHKNPRLREELGERARETIVESRSWEARIEKELKVFTSLPLQEYRQ